VPVAPTPSRVVTLVTRVGAWFGRGWQSIRQVCTSFTGWIGEALSRAHRRWQLVRQFHVPLLTAVVVGAASGTAAFWGGPYVAALAGWLAGFTTTLTVQAGLWLRRALDSFPPAGA
jgi:hypothetical protein